ncbi:MAG: TolC family outer membrane protein [Alphaproteobacteria bacterium]|nr:TolC family outer membrane protein [Alphaproteobacteria bacterium]
MYDLKRFMGSATLVAGAALAVSAPALAETMEGALVHAYLNNPQLNAQRAQVRVTDEGVPQALSGYRPNVNVSVSGGYQYTNTVVAGVPISQAQTPRAVALTVGQTLYNGGRTGNSVRAAESQVSGSREALRSLDQTVLLQGATAYMDYLRDAAIVEVQKNNVRVLEQTLKQTQDRFDVGEVTRTDVAQSEASLAAGKTQELTAEANLTATRANYRRIIGKEPQNLQPGSPVDRVLPPKLGSAIELSLMENPNVTASMHGIDVSYLQVKVAEGALLPTISLQGIVQQNDQQSPTVGKTFNAAGLLQMNVPLYQGGQEYSLIRQSKETLAQQRLALEMTRDQTRANVVQAWGQLDAGKAQVTSANAQVKASEIALNGVREEAKAGQRTTLDVLNAQQALVTARVALVTAQHDRVVASYAVLNAVGRLSPQVLRLPVTTYDPSVHYHQVRDSWAGVRTPDGR